MALIYGACLSVVIVLGLTAQLVIACLKNLLAAAISLLDESMKSIVKLLLSAAL